MFQRRAPINKPQTQNFSRSSRQIVETRKIDLSPMSIQPPLKESYYPTKPSQQMKIIAESNAIQRFFFTRKDYVLPPVTDPPTQPDTTLLWSYTVPKILSAQRKTQLAFRQQEYVISNFAGTGFPQIIYICCDSFSGYLNELGVPTTRVAALILTDLNPVLDSTETHVYDLRYSLRENAAWQIPPTLTQLKFRVMVDKEQEFAVLPLVNEIVLDFEIRHM